MSTHRRSRAIIAGVATLAVAGGFAATFTATSSAPAQKIGTGTLAITLDTVAPTTWTDNISNLAAGDSISRYLNVRNSGTLPIASAALSQTNTLGALLTSPSDVSVKFEACSVAWTVATGACSGTVTAALDTTALSGWTTGTKNLTGFDALSAGSSKYLKLTTTLAQGAPNAVQGTTGAITYTFGASQRAAGTDFNGAGVAGGAAAGNSLTNATWASAASMNYQRAWAATGTDSQGRIYAFGGQGVVNGTNTYVGAVERYDSTTDKWTVVSSQTARRMMASTTVGDWIYLMGGASLNSATLSTNAERYNTVTGAWETLTDLPASVSGAVAGHDADGNVYLIGGSVNNTVSNAVYKYSPVTKTWTTVASAPYAQQYGSSVTSSDGKIYLMGGYSGNYNGYIKSMAVYDPSTNSWKSLKSMIGQRAYGAAVLDQVGKIHVIGGYAQESGALAGAENYDIASDTWTAVSNPANLYASSAEMDAQGRLYLIGGTVSNTYTNGVLRLG